MAISALNRAMLRAQETVLSRNPKPMGAQRALATVLDVTPQAVSQWVACGYVPTDRALQIEATLGIPFRELVDPALVEPVCPAPCGEQS